MSANIKFNKALRYLDLGKFDKGEEALKECIHLAERNSDYNTLIQVYCCYGEFLNESGKKDKALVYLKKVIDLKEKTDDDLFDYEFNRAKELMKDIQGVE